MAVSGLYATHAETAYIYVEKTARLRPLRHSTNAVSATRDRAKRLPSDRPGAAFQSGCNYMYAPNSLLRIIENCLPFNRTAFKTDNPHFQVFLGCDSIQSMSDACLFRQFSQELTFMHRCLAFYPYFSDKLSTSIVHQFNRGSA